jgi:hypothetical protein
LAVLVICMLVLLRKLSPHACDAAKGHCSPLPVLLLLLRLLLP